MTLSPAGCKERRNTQIHWHLTVQTLKTGVFTGHRGSDTLPDRIQQTPEGQRGGQSKGHSGNGESHVHTLVYWGLEAQGRFCQLRYLSLSGTVSRPFRIHCPWRGPALPVMAEGNLCFAQASEGWHQRVEWSHSHSQVQVTTTCHAEKNVHAGNTNVHLGNRK